MERIGIVIAPKVRGGYAVAPDLFWYEFKVAIGGYLKGTPYVTSRSIRESITNGKLTAGWEVGRLTFIVDKDKKEIQPYQYFPLLKAEFLRKMGVATNIELACLRHLRKEFKGYSVVDSQALWPPRKHQLEARRDESGEGLDVRIKKSQKYLVRQHRLHKPLA
ncbi:MAG: hypothetical protein V1676_06095 [Candidatus Diapherotrites archaeon]